MSRILDPSRANEVASQVISDFEYDAQLTAEEIIPGLVEAIKLLAKQTADPLQAVDEALVEMGEEEA